MPMKPHSKLAAIARYGLASAPGRRFSTRRFCGPASGTRRPTVRFSSPHSTFTGAEVSGRKRRNELTLGANSGSTTGMNFCRPPTWLRNSSLICPSASEKMFLPVCTSMMLWCRCMALPGSPVIGLAMKVAATLCLSAASRMVRLNTRIWSARDRASP
ncbi:hypothetical protein D9M71_597190 [compost metagenome]